MTAAPSTLAEFLDQIDAPTPWAVRLVWSRREEVHALFDAKGRDLDLRVYDTEGHARAMATLNAFAPRLMAYVETSAAKGGKEATEIVNEFRAAIAVPAPRGRP